MISKISTARRLLHLKVKALKEQKGLQATLEKLKRTAIQRETTDLHEELARRARIAEKKAELAKVSSSCGSNFGSFSPVDSFTENSGRMKKWETAKNGTTSIIAVSVHSTPENAVKLAPMRDSKPPTETVGPNNWEDNIKADNGACRQGATSKPAVKVPNKGNSKLLTAE